MVCFVNIALGKLDFFSLGSLFVCASVHQDLACPGHNFLMG